MPCTHRHMRTLILQFRYGIAMGWASLTTDTPSSPVTSTAFEGNPVPNKTRGRSSVKPLHLLFKWVFFWICFTVFSRFTVLSLSRNGHKSNWTNILIIQEKRNPQHHLKTCYMMHNPQVPTPSSSGRSYEKRSALIFRPLRQVWQQWFPRAFYLRETASNPWSRGPGPPHSLGKHFQHSQQRGISRRRSDIVPQGNKWDDISLKMFSQLLADSRQTPATGFTQVIFSSFSSCL